MAVVFHDACNTSANYTTVGANTTFGGNNGMFGTLGASGSMHINFSGGNYVYEGANKTLSATCTVFQFYYRPASNATIGNGNTIFNVFTDNTFTNSSSPIRIDMRANGTGFSFSLISNANSYATTTGSTVFSLGTAVRLCLYQTSSGWQLFLNNSTTAEITYSLAQSTIGYANVGFGTNDDNATGSYTGIADIDEIWCGNLNTAPTTTAGKIADAYQGYLQNHLSADGQPYRGPTDGTNLSSAAAIDTVSETVGYLLKLAVQQNDQTSFNAADNWALQNLLRSVSTTTNTQNNGGPTTALNLMCFHYNSANTDGKGIGTIYDANFATDADCDRMEALFWAHGRWGSSTNTVGSAAELTTPNYLQRALNVASDIRQYGMGNSTGTGFNYLLNDSFQVGNATVQIAPDYNNPVAFHLAAQYDTANTAFWNAAVSGAYDVLEKAATVIFSGNSPAQTTTANLNPDWISFTLSTATVGTSPSTYGDNNYGYNAFRTYSRLYDAYVFYGDSGALTALQEPKSFFTSQWSTNTKIFATYNHDGTNPATYESNMFYFADYWTLYANDTANTTASAINTNKLSNTYNQAPFGSYFTTAPGGSQYGYFDQSWLIYNYMQQSGTLTNYGQATAAAVRHNQFFSFF